MKVFEIRGGKFYTNGETVFFKGNDKKFYCFANETETCYNGAAAFLNRGVYACGVGRHYSDEVRLVETGEEFYNGNIKVIDVKNLSILRVKNNAKFDSEDYLVNFNELEEKRYFDIVNIKNC